MGSSKQSNYMVNNVAREINLREYYEVLKKRIWLIILITFLTTVAGYVYNYYTQTNLYESSRRVIIGSDSGNMSTLMVMIKDPIIMEKVRDELNLSRSPEGIANQITVAQIDDSQVIKISAVDADPKVAMAIVNSTAKLFKSEIATILDFKEVQLLSEAKENPYPINPSGNRITIIAFVLGMITAVGLAFLLDSLDQTIKTNKDIEEYLDITVLGKVSNMNKKKFVIKRKSQPEMELRGDTVGIK
ncbi:Wzz/FepE/Etk N-terminal domain-containing protein [Rossellomorea sp. DA94]|uniref:YveK family protein n=1 Tax=Rossellomorea sp. DA94 TaxID=3038653 RepID=UPI00244B9ABD|nr:Wzz/FepE/Etk N-terminal domain-containing protein [Rossellomorea sp. DA94]WGG45849.1 Wzz/FepE/Etk N-terminal domain-containing protein [Rossellomorea sp. DA94]